MTKTQPTLPLSRFKVLDLTRVRAGPTAVRQLADWGANVIKVEKPSRPGEESGFASRHGPDFQNLHRNKRSMTLNLKDPEGVAIFKRIVEKVDVVVENYRPEVKYRLGIDYESLKKVNARLVYASISGFGQNGPYRNLPGYDQVAQGLGGLMSITGLPGQGPVRAGIPIADLTAGLYCAIGILVALLEREESGEGQWVHTSLLEAQIAMLDFQAVRWLMDKDIPQQAGNYHPTSVPTGVYPTRDGHINIAVAGSEIYKRFCQVIGREDWLDDPKFSTPEARYQNRDEINADIAEITATRSSQEWVRLFNEASVPCGPINTIDKTFEDPQVRHLGMAQPVKHSTLGTIEILSQAVHLERTPFQMRSASPDPGEHTEEILSELNINADQVADLRRRGIV
jgi:crotonobetainyl-CoA:carnitine CoA-transferase CaiB-like acyl-CoA transferase